MRLFKKNNYPAYLGENLSFGKQAAIFVWEIFKVVVISLAIIIPVRYFLIQPFYVKGASMEPNFYNHEYLIINEISYRFVAPERGDAIVLRYPLEPSQYFIKRIIGLPGEKVRVAGGQVYIFNAAHPAGEPLKEDYLPSGLLTYGDAELTLGADEYFVLGDNRSASLDSRVFGPITRRDIIGKTLLRGWPLNRIGLVSTNIDYNL